MDKYKFTSENKESRYYTGNTRKTNATFMQIGENFVEIDDVKKEQAKAEFKKKLKEADEPVEAGSDVKPSTEKLMSVVHNYIVKYLRAQGIQSNFANILADRIMDLTNRISDKGYSTSIDKYLGAYLQKFYKSIGMGD